jgi:hypothetical protein
MSKKVIAFTLPPRAAQADPVSREPDRWVAEPESTASTPNPNHMVIDLSANRTWFELAGLICTFPYLASWCWMQNTANTWLSSFKPR